MEHLQLTYHLDVDAVDAPLLAESVLLEQSVETPLEVAERHPYVREHMLGSIRELTPAPEGGFLLEMTLPVVTASVDVAQFLNVVFGNASLHPAVTLVGFALPRALEALFRGPAFGIQGLRAETGVTRRPLTCSALKPVGQPLEDIVALCRTFAEGGVDLVKDDHYLADHPFCPFDERLRRCQAAVDEVGARTGHRAVYVPNLSGTPEQIRRQADLAQEAGARAVMVAPMLVGLPFFFELTTSRLEVPVLAHPSFAGAGRIRIETLLGDLFRLYGADAVIFANYGGRFSYEREVCGLLAERLRRPWASFRPAFPVPAGGMRVESAPELVRFFGLDTVLLVGGSLLLAGDRLLERTRAFVESVERAASTLQVEI